MSYQRFEGSFLSFDSTRIFYQSWETKKAEASVIITHGQGEHSESYHRVVDYFQNKHVNFYAWDMRGHGRSDGLRGYAASFGDYIKDCKLYWDLILQKVDKSKPVFILAHSMGGLVQLTSLLEYPQESFTAQVLSAPLLGLAVAVPAFKKHGAELLVKLLPKVTLGNEITNEMLTRDPAIMLEFDKDTLRHGRISSAVYLGFLEHFEIVKNRANEIKIPSLFVCSDKDPVIDSQAVIDFENMMGSTDKKIVLYGNGAKHEMFNDTHRLDVLKEVENYLEQFTKDSK